MVLLRVLSIKNYATRYMARFLVLIALLNVLMINDTTGGGCMNDIFGVKIADYLTDDAVYMIPANARVVAPLFEIRDTHIEGDKIKSTLVFKLPVIRGSAISVK